MDGFLFDDAVDATTIVQLAENEIRAVTAPIPISPTTATFVDGVWTGNITVSQAVSSMYLRISDGSGHASNSNAFTVAAASSSYVYQSGTLDGNLTGSSGLTKTGDGVLTLSGVNSYTGGTTVSSGTLIITSSSAMPTKGVFTVAGGGSVVTLVTPVSSSVATNSASGTQPLDQVATVDELLLSTAFKPSSPAALTAGSQPLASSVASPQAHDAVFASAALSSSPAIFNEPPRMIGPTRSAAPAPTTLDDLLATFNWPLG